LRRHQEEHLTVAGTETIGKFVDEVELRTSLRMVDQQKQKTAKRKGEGDEASR
jgi:hypothetical protein